MSFETCDKCDEKKPRCCGPLSFCKDCCPGTIHFMVDPDLRVTVETECPAPADGSRIELALERIGNLLEVIADRMPPR